MDRIAAIRRSATTDTSTICTTATCITTTKDMLTSAAWRSGMPTPDACRPVNDKDNHVHGDSCGHAAVPHGDHTDYLVDGVLHHPHADHCDDHGRVDVV